MAVRSKIAADAVGTAVQPWQVAPLATQYRRLYTQYDAICEADGPEGPLEGARTGVFHAIAEMAGAIMQVAPASLDDVALQLGMAASWCNFVMAGLDEDGAKRNVGLGIESAVQNATRFLWETRGAAAYDGDALAVLTDLYAEAVKSGAEMVARA